MFVRYAIALTVVRYAIALTVTLVFVRYAIALTVTGVCQVCYSTDSYWCLLQVSATDLPGGGLPGVGAHRGRCSTDSYWCLSGML